MTDPGTPIRRKRRGLSRPVLIGGAIVAAGALGLGVVGVRQFGQPSSVTTAATRPMTFSQIFDRVAPAVVSVEVVGEGNPILRFFQQQADPRAAAEPSSAGSGFFMSADGLVVTNDHVIDGARQINVSLHDGRTLPARVVGRDPGADLAVLRVSDPRNRNARYPFVDFQDQARPRVGDWVLAVGNPFGLGGTATAGIVSAFGRDIDASGLVEYLQIDAALNRGDFGGPSFDVYGRVIGVNTAIFSPSGGSIGIGFAIPAADAEKVVKALAQGKEIARGFIGASVQTLSAEQAQGLGVAGRKGALVAGVTAGGPADRAGLQPGDLIVAIDGQPITTSAELTRRVAGSGPDKRIALTLLREGRERTLTVRTGTRPPPRDLERQQPR